MKKSFKKWFGKLSGGEKTRLLKKAKEDLVNLEIYNEKLTNTIEQYEKNIKNNLAKRSDPDLSRIRKEQIAAKIKEIHAAIQQKEKQVRVCHKQINSLKKLINEIDLGTIGGSVTAEDFEFGRNLASETMDSFMERLESEKSFSDTVDQNWSLIEKDLDDGPDLDDIERRYADPLNTETPAGEPEEAEEDPDIAAITRKYMTEI